MWHFVITEPLGAVLGSGSTVAFAWKAAAHTINRQSSDRGALNHE